MATERSVYLRIGVKDADRALAELKRLGIGGERALKQVGAGGPGASKALLAVDAASKSARSGLGELAQQASRIGGPLGGVASQATLLASALRGGGGAATVAAAGFAALAAGAGASIGSFAQYERQMFRLTAQVRATGGAAGLTARQIEEMADRLGDATLTSAEVARNASSALLSFSRIGGEIFEETLQRAQDLAEVFGRDLQGAAVQVGKALQDPVRGMGELREAGISFTQSQIEAARALQETGRHAEAQRIVLDQLGRQVGGAGVGAAGGLKGQFDSAGEAATHFGDRLGEIITKNRALNVYLSDVTNAFRLLTDAITPANGGIGAGWDEMRGALDELKRRQAALDHLVNAGGETFATQRVRLYRDAVAEARAEVERLRTAIADRQSVQAEEERADKARAAAAAAEREAKALADQSVRRDGILAASAEELRLARLSADQRAIEEAAIKAVAEAKKKEIYNAGLLATIEADARKTAEAKLAIQHARADAAQQEAEAAAAAAKAADDLARRNADLEKYIGGLEDEVTLAGMGSDERERHVALLKAAEAVQRELTAEEAARVSIAVQQRQAMEAQEAAAQRQAAAARRRQEQWREAEKQAAEEMRRDWEHTGDRIVDIFADAMAGVRADGVESMRGLAEDGREAVIRALSQIDMEILVRPMTQAIGSAGLSGLRELAPLGLAAAGSASQSTILSALGAGSSLLQGGSTFGTQALHYAVSSAPGLTSSLGLSQAASGFYNTGIGGSGYALTGLGSSLASGINASPYGAVGTVGAQLLGFEANNPYVGAGLGIAGSIGGGAAGAALGSALGLAGGGPVGAIAGAFLAQVLSSYIGSGASVGPNESAYLGTSGGRFQVGGSGQDNGGNASQAIGVVQSAADGLNALIEAAGLSIANPESGFWHYGVGTPGVSPYTATSAEQLIGQVLGSGRLSASDPDIAAALQHSGGSLEQILGDVAFAQNFGDAITGLKRSTLDYASVLEVQAKAAVEEQTAQIQQFIGVTARLGLDVGAAESAARDYVRTLVGLQPEPEALTPVEDALTRINAQFSAMGPLLRQVGITAAEAEGGVAALRERIQMDFVHGLQAGINEATGLGVVNAVSGLIAQAEAHRRSAVASGADVSLVDQWLQAQIVQQLSRADEAGVLGVLTQLVGNPVAVAAATDALAALRAQVEELGVAATVTIGDLAGADQLLRDEVAAGVREMADAARVAADAFGGFATSLGRYRQDLLVGDLSPLSAGAQLDTARARVEALRSGIASGDQASFQEMQNAVASFLGASRQFNASGPGYSADFGLAQDLLAQAEAQAAEEEARARAVQDAALRQVDELRGIRSVLDGLSAPLVEFARLGAQVMTGQAGGASATAARDALLQQMGPDELAVALGSLQSGGQAVARGILGERSFSDEIQASLRDQFQGLGAQVTAGSIGQDEAIRQQLALFARSDLETLQGFQGIINPKGANAGALADFMAQLSGDSYARLQGYATGGIVGREGAYRLAEGGRPEAVVPLPDGRSIPVVMTGGGGGDTRALQAEVRALRDQVAALSRVVAAAGDRQIEALGTVAGNTGEMARKLRLAAARS